MSDSVTRNEYEAEIERTASTGGARRPTLTREEWNTRYATKDLIWTAGPSPRFAEEVSSLAPGKALDLAAGEGRNALWLAEQGWHVTAVDLSDVAIDKARGLAHARKLADQLDLHVCDLRHYAFASGSYDLVAIIYLHMPWSDLSKILEKAAASVADGGTFLLLGHDLANISQGFGGPRDPDFLYTSDQIIATIGNNFRIEKAQRVERSVETTDGPKVAVDCLVKGVRI